MGKNLLASLALAGSMLAAEPVKGQEGADTAAKRTNKALVELLNELPAGFDKAWEVIKSNIALTTDGDLSDADKLKIDGDMWKLATTVVAEKAKKVMEAMNGIETVVAVVGDRGEGIDVEKDKTEKQDVDPKIDSIITELSTPDETRISGLLSFREGEVQIWHKIWTITFFKKKMPVSIAQRKKNFIASWTSTGNITVKLTALDRKWNPIPGFEFWLENDSPIRLPEETRFIFLDVVSFWGTADSAVKGVIPWVIEKIWFLDPEVVAEVK